MPTMQVQVRRFSVVSSRPFEEIVTRLTATIGHPDMNAFHRAVAAATTVADLEAVVQGAIGSSDLMEFTRFDAGDVLRKGRGRTRAEDPPARRRSAAELYSNGVRLTVTRSPRRRASASVRPTWASDGRVKMLLGKIE